MPPQTRTDRHKADSIKAGGVVYTPPALAQFLAAQAFDALEVETPIRILDPACGDGELLLAAVAEAHLRGLEVKAVVGYDIDQDAVDKAATRLESTPGATVHQADFLALAAESSGPAEPDLFDIGGASRQLEFELVISNPPYVRTQTLGADVAQTLGTKFGLTGRVDLYHAFTVAMIRALADGGGLGLLCSNKFLTNKAGTSMRRLLLEQLDLSEIVDLGDTKLFEAAVLPVIVSGTRVSNGKQKRETVGFRSVYEVKAHASPIASPIIAALSDRTSGGVVDGERTFVIRAGLLDVAAGHMQPWNPMDAATRARFSVLRKSKVKTLGDLGKIKVGVKTTADPVFIRTDWGTLPNELQPEAELVHQLITHHDIEPWDASQGARRILYPHRDNNGRSAAVDLTGYPRAAAYLESHRERLEGRKYVINGGRNWYEIWVPQKPGLWKLPKLVFPDIAETPRFAIDRTGAIVNGDCYWLTIEDDDLADVVTAVGNSSFCTWFYDAACGNFLYAGRRRFMTQYMERLPIPNVTENLVEEIRGLHATGDAEGLDELVWRSLGVEKPFG